jgi:hypothetical protein
MDEGVWMDIYGRLMIDRKKLLGWMISVSDREIDG